MIPTEQVLDLGPAPFEFEFPVGNENDPLTAQLRNFLPNELQEVFVQLERAARVQRECDWDQWLPPEFSGAAIGLWWSDGCSSDNNNLLKSRVPHDER